MDYRKNYITLVGILGTVFEWLEYSYYGYLTTKISQLFFPQWDPRTGLIATMGIFAAGFIMRPIGGVLFGYLGDRKGRKKALFISLLLMGSATFLMGVLPTYQTIGILAPLLLLLCRLLQGLAVSGEFNGAAIFLIEHNKNAYPTLAGSWVGTASACGMLLGALSAMIVTGDGMPSWAWRVPFFLAFACCLIASYLRYRILETPHFLKACDHGRLVKFPLLAVLKNYKRAFFNNVILAAFVSVYIYVCNMFLVNYLIHTIHIHPPTAISLAGLGELVVVLIFPLAAIGADKLGPKIVMTIGFCLTLLVTPLLFFFATTGSILLIALGQIFYGLANAIAFAPIFYFIYKQFPTPLRYTGNSTAWSVGVALFGSSAPIVADYLTREYSIYAPALYVSLFVILAGLVIWRLGEKKKELAPAFKKMEVISLQALMRKKYDWNK